jgi:hypothetical protein
MLGHYSRLFLVDRYDLIKLLLSIILHARYLGLHHLSFLASPGLQQGPHGFNLCVFLGDFFSHKRYFLDVALHKLGLEYLISGINGDLHMAIVE